MYISQVFRLTMVLDSNKFNHFFTKQNLLETDGDEYIDSSLSHKGIIVLYRNSQYKKKVSLIANPDFILKGREQDAHKFIHKLEKRIEDYFSGQYRLEDFMLTELTLAANINVGSQDTVDSYIRVIQRIGKVKGFSLAHYDGFDKDSSFCLEGNSNGISFFLYDLWTAVANSLSSEITHKDRKTILGGANGILRTEIHLKSSKAIRGYSDRDNTTSQIINLMGRSEEIFISTFVQIIPRGDFYKKSDAVDIIRQRVKNFRLQRRMIRLIGLISEKKSLLLAQKAMSYREPDKLLIAFAEIGLSPITISKRMDAKYLPSLYSYMNCNITYQEVEKDD